MRAALLFLSRAGMMYVSKAKALSTVRCQREEEPYGVNKLLVAPY